MHRSVDDTCYLCDFGGMIIFLIVNWIRLFINYSVIFVLFYNCIVYSYI